VLAATADAHGAHGLAFDALLAAVPFAAVAALVSFGEYLDGREEPLVGLQSLLWALAVALLVISCAARAPAPQTHDMPPHGRSARVGCLAVFALKACVAAAPYLRLAWRPAKP
jgi:hypothetical protein